MDISLAKTFLAIADLGAFQKAAEQLNITQSTVSARIKQLEDLLGQPLFVRSKSGAHPTLAGVQFKPFAQKIVQTWEQARQEVLLPDNFRRRLSVGVQFALWERLMVQWLPWMRRAVPDYAIRAEVGAPDMLMRGLVDGLFNLAITYTPQNRGGLIVERLMEEKLVLVSAQPSSKGVLDDDYIFVDWGPEFRMEHAAEFPNREATTITTNYGPLALQYLREGKGAAYLPQRLVRRSLDDQILHLVHGAPTFMRPVYVVYLESEESTRFDTALQGLRYVASLESE